MVGLAVGALTVAVALAPLAPAVAKATQQCPAGGVKVQVTQSPASVSVTDTTAGASVPVVVTVTGATFTVTPAAGTGALENATWCVKASTRTNFGNGTAGASTATNKRGVVHDISYVVLYSVVTTIAPWPVPQCWESSSVDQPDMLYVGPANVASPDTNTIVIDSFDGSCIGEELVRIVIIRATDDTASALCRTLKLVPLGGGALLMNNISYPTAPADAYYCVYL